MNTWFAYWPFYPYFSFQGPKFVGQPFMGRMDWLSPRLFKTLFFLRTHPFIFSLPKLSLSFQETKFWNNTQSRTPYRSSHPHDPETSEQFVLINSKICLVVYKYSWKLNILTFSFVICVRGHECVSIY